MGIHKYHIDAKRHLRVQFESQTVSLLYDLRPFDPALMSLEIILLLH